MISVGYGYLVLSEDRWQKLIAKKPMVTSTPIFYVTQSALTAGFSDEGKPG
ncbi:hypothetical protein [Providencia alcalifaciens]|uniref:hypothetical protein n=1 Tax=Providencia alcalifaciens TaxID=126385 RepID=UPI002B060D4C|nr:hypothetical protein [Providencia alcalifaciens]